MKFYEIVKELQKENKGKIVLIRNGIFYCAIGKDTVLMNNVLGYIPVCFKENVCKCGIPVNGIEIAIPKMLRSGFGYVIYDYNKEEKTYKKIVELKGKYVYSKDNNIGCSNCLYKENKMKSTEEYVGELGKVIKRFENEQK